MTIPPIGYGPRISREEAMKNLMRDGYTAMEASQFLNEPDPIKRMAISDAVHKKELDEKETA